MYKEWYKRKETGYHTNWIRETWKGIFSQCCCNDEKERAFCTTLCLAMKSRRAKSTANEKNRICSQDTHQHRRQNRIFKDYLVGSDGRHVLLDSNKTITKKGYKEQLIRLSQLLRIKRPEHVIFQQDSGWTHVAKPVCATTHTHRYKIKVQFYAKRSPSN